VPDQDWRARKVPDDAFQSIDQRYLVRRLQNAFRTRLTDDRDALRRVRRSCIFSSLMDVRIRGGPEIVLIGNPPERE
jgi:hypothetical protein